MNDNIQLKTKLLNLLEERYKKDPNFFVNKSTISVELGITEEEAFRCADYLVNNKWATVSEPQTSRWRIMITEEGRKERERIRNVIVDEKKNNTNEQFGDAKLSKNEEKIKDVNLEKIPSEKSESPQGTQKENPKETLQAYLLKLKKAKESRSAHNVQRDGERLLEFVKKLQLTYVEFAQLNEELVTMINMSFTQRRSNMLSSDRKSLNSLFDKYVADDIDKVIYDVEALIDSPKEITLRKKLLSKEKKKSWFSKLFSSKQKDSQMLEESLEIPIDNFQGIFNVFISHKFVKSDQKLALELRKELRKNQIEGYLAESTREYELLIGEKIRDAIDKSEYMVGIITEQSQTSASFNQELGYALGIKKPIVIMIESGVQHGVLTHGRETEEFTRKKFSKACENIVNYILDHGKPVKISNQERMELIQNVYEPCYNQMMNAYQSREFITEIPHNPWENISYSWKLRTDEEIKKLFENFDNELRVWHRMWIDFENKFQSSQKDIAKFLDPVFEKFKLIKENGRFVFGGSNHDSESWLFNCHDVIFNENISSGEELYQILKRNSIKRWGDRYAITYDVWKKEIPEIYNEILKVIPKLIDGLEAKYSYKEIDVQRNILKKSIEELTLALEEKLK